MKELTKCFKGGNKQPNLVQITALANECTKTNLKAKEKYIRQLSQKLSDPSTELKTYWKIINRFVSNKKIRNKITGSFNMVLLGAVNNSNRYITKIY